MSFFARSLRLGYVLTLALIVSVLVRPQQSQGQFRGNNMPGLPLRLPAPTVNFGAIGIGIFPGVGFTGFGFNGFGMGGFGMGGFGMGGFGMLPGFGFNGFGFNGFGFNGFGFNGFGFNGFGFAGFPAFAGGVRFPGGAVNFGIAGVPGMGMGGFAGKRFGGFNGGNGL